MISCPICQRHVKRYKICLTTHMLIWIGILVRFVEDTIAHIRIIHKKLSYNMHECI